MADHGTDRANASTIQKMILQKEDVPAPTLMQSEHLTGLDQDPGWRKQHPDVETFPIPGVSAILRIAANIKDSIQETDNGSTGTHQNKTHTDHRIGKINSGSLGTLQQQQTEPRHQNMET